MPTKEQLHLILESQFEFFGGAGQPKANYEGSSESHGLTAEKRMDTPLVPKYSLIPTSGDVLGKVSFDSETNDFKIVAP
jgi:hypothetical protein